MEIIYENALNKVITLKAQRKLGVSNQANDELIDNLDILLADLIDNELAREIK